MNGSHYPAGDTIRSSAGSLSVDVPPYVQFEYVADSPGLQGGAAEVEMNFSYSGTSSHSLFDQHVSFVVTSALPNLNLPRYSQGNSKWATATYDHDGTIQQNGCALSAMAWVLSAYGYTINPLQLNDWLNERPGSKGGFYGASVNWNAIAILSGGQLTAVETKTPTNRFGKTAYSHDPSILNGYLSSSDLVMVEVNNGGDTHWVVVEPEINARYPIMDPGYSGRKNLSSYGDEFWSYVVVSQSNAKPR